LGEFSGVLIEAFDGPLFEELAFIEGGLVPGAELLGGGFEEEGGAEFRGGGVCPAGDDVVDVGLFARRDTLGAPVTDGLDADAKAGVHVGGAVLVAVHPCFEIGCGFVHAEDFALSAKKINLFC